MSETVIAREFHNTVPEHIVEGLLAHMRGGTTHLTDEVMVLDGAIFVDPDLAARERHRVFSATPFIAAHSSEIPNPRDFITKRLPRNEAIIVRGEDGTLRAFVNQCRHRGATLTNDESGHCRVFSCRYHGWSYDLEGQLRNITFPDTFGDVDRSTLGLVELPVEERHGFVWVLDNPAGTIDVASFLGAESDAALTSYRIADMVLFRAGTFDEPVNWKVMHDAFLDGYHIKFAHPQTANRMVHTNIYVIEDYGNHARFASPRRSLDAWLDSDPDPDTPMAEHVMLSHFIGPNNTLLQLGDNYQLLSFYPIDDNPAWSRMEMRLMVPTLEMAGESEELWRSRWEKNWHVLEKVLLNEDFPILRDIQRAYASADRQPTVLGRNEVLNQAFHREIAKLRDTDLPTDSPTPVGVRRSE